MRVHHGERPGRVQLGWERRTSRRAQVKGVAGEPPGGGAA